VLLRRGIVFEMALDVFILGIARMVDIYAAVRQMVASEISFSI
jgi:hypothetical protein